jgi:hypothetical protein
MVGVPPLELPQAARVPAQIKLTKSLEPGLRAGRFIL